MTAVFRHPADRVPVAAFASIFVVDVAAYLFLDNPIWLALYFLVGILPKGAVCAFNHHHQHVSTFRKPILNRALEIMYALQTGVSSHAWVLHHSVGHHLNYLDQDKDESRWMRKDRSIMGQVEYSLITSATAYVRAWKVGAKFPKYRKIFLVMGLVTVAMISALVSYRPMSGFFVFVLAPAFSLFGTAWATYSHHSSRSTDSHFVASTNVLQPLYNVWTGNLGYHTAHHYRPGVHWSKLKELHAKIADEIPADAYVPAGWPWRLAGPGEIAVAEVEKAQAKELVSTS
jgi:fatty acid desaturase